VATQTQLKSDLKQHKADRTETKEAMEEATAIREKEAAEFAKYKSEAETNIAAMGKAIGPSGTAWARLLCRPRLLMSCVIS